MKAATTAKTGATGQKPSNRKQNCQGSGYQNIKDSFASYFHSSMSTALRLAIAPIVKLKCCLCKKGDV